MNDYDSKKIDRNAEIVKTLERYLEGIKHDSLVDDELQKSIFQMTTDLNFLIVYEDNILSNSLGSRDETYMFKEDEANAPFLHNEKVKIKIELINTKSTYCGLKRSSYAGKTGVVTKVGLGTCNVMFPDNMELKFYNKHIEKEK